MQLTYQTRIQDRDILVYNYLEDYAEYFSILQRKLFYEYYIKGLSLNELKKKYIAEHELTARQFNSLRSDLGGKVEALEKIRDGKIEDLKGRIKSLQSWLKKKEKQRVSMHGKSVKANKSRPEAYQAAGEIQAFEICTAPQKAPTEKSYP